MRDQGNLVGANANFDVDTEGSSFAIVSFLKDMLSNFEEALDFVTKSNVSLRKERMLAVCHQLRFVISPPMIDLPQKGSIRNLQQNVNFNRFGKKRSIASSLVSFEDIGSGRINKPDKTTGRFGWGMQGSREGVRLPRFTKIQCMHCKCRLLILGKHQTSHCRHSNSMLMPS